jgi:hypothetical protein
MINSKYCSDALGTIQCKSSTVGKAETFKVQCLKNCSPKSSSSLDEAAEADFSVL